jgi:hypothetical protein
MTGERRRIGLRELAVAVLARETPVLSMGRPSKDWPDRPEPNSFQLGVTALVLATSVSGVDPQSPRQKRHQGVRAGFWRQLLDTLSAKA